MKKVKQLFRHSIGRAYLPPQKITSYQKTFSLFVRNFKNAPKFFNTINTQKWAQYHSEQSSVERIQYDPILADKKGLLNLLPTAAPKSEIPEFGDFQGVSKSNFVHALTLPKHEVEFAKFTIDEVKSVYSEAIDEFELFEAKKVQARLRVKEGRAAYEKARQNVKKITSVLQVVKVEDVMKELRRNLLGYHPALVLQKH